MKKAKLGNVLVLTYWSYRDALIQTYTLPYVRMIRKQLPASCRIYLLTLEQARLKMSEDETERVVAELKREGIHLITFKHSKFGLKAMLMWSLFITRLFALCLRERIAFIHAWCTPAGAAGVILSIVTRRPLIIDSYEPHAEAMVENGSWRANSLAFKILFFLEKLQSRRARTVIATARGMRDYAREKYGARFDSFYVKPACVDLDKFSPARIKDTALVAEHDLDGKIVCVYAGKIGGIYLEREIFDLFKAASDYWGGEKFRALLLTDAEPERVRRLAAESDFAMERLIVKFVEHKDVPRYLGLGDFAINPVKPVPTKRFCTSIKDGEYWALGLPVVIPPNISDDSDIIAENRIGSVIAGFTPESYLRSIREIDALLNEHSKEELSNKIRRVAVKHRSFADAEKIYEEIYGVRR